MDQTDGIEVMTEACLKAHETVEEHGTSEMQAIMRVLLCTRPVMAAVDGIAHSAEA